MATNIHAAEKDAIRPSTVPPTVKGLSLVSLFNDLASEMVYPLLPALVTRTLGGGPLLLGILDGASELTSSVLKWIGGRLADKPGWRRPLILGGYATAVLVRPLIALTSRAWQVVGFRVIDRIGKGLRTAPRDALISDLTPANVRGRAFGFHRGADHLGAVLGSLTAWWLLQRGADVRSVIQWSIVPGVVAFVVLAVVLRGGGAEGRRVGGAESRRGGQSGGRTDRRPGGRLNSQADEIAATSAEPFDQESDPPSAPPPLRPPAPPPDFWPPILGLTALTFFRLPETLLILRLQDLGVAVAAVPLVWAGLHVVRSASSYPGGWLSDRWGPRKVVAAGGLLFASVAFALGMALGPTPAVALFLLLGLVAGLTESGERSLVARLAPVRTGRGFGVYHALTGAAALPAGIIFGALYQSASGRAALWASAAGMVAAVIVWLLISPSHKQQARV